MRENEAVVNLIQSALSIANTATLSYLLFRIMVYIPEIMSGSTIRLTSGSSEVGLCDAKGLFLK